MINAANAGPTMCIKWRGSQMFISADSSIYLNLSTVMEENHFFKVILTEKDSTRPTF